MNMLIKIFLFILMGNSCFAQDSRSMVIQVEGFRNKNGLIHLSLFQSAEGFPENAKKAVRNSTMKIDGDVVLFYFDNLDAGEYAFSVLHDENKDNKMNKNFLGIPKEGFAFSTNYSPKGKSPSFSDTSYSWKPGNPSLVVQLIYYL